MCVSEIRVKRIRVNQGLGVHQVCCMNNQEGWKFMMMLGSLFKRENAMLDDLIWNNKSEQLVCLPENEVSACKKTQICLQFFWLLYYSWKFYNYFDPIPYIAPKVCCMNNGEGEGRKFMMMLGTWKTQAHFSPLFDFAQAKNQLCMSILYHVFHRYYEGMRFPFELLFWSLFSFVK